MLGKVLIGSRSFGKFTKKGINILKEHQCEIISNPFGHALNEKELLKLIPEVSGVITGMDQLTNRVISSANKLKVISKHGIGVDNIDIKAAGNKNIVVTNIPAGKEESNAVADFTFALILSIARKICEMDRNMKKGNWTKAIGSEVFGKTLGIIGSGAIGKSVIARAKGFDMNILVNDIHEDKELIKKFGVKYVDLDYLLNNSDFVSIHVPLNETTRRLIAKKELNSMKNSSYLINTARGGIVDEKDLYEALNTNTIAGAALDVFFEEPPRKSPLLELNNLVTTPHMAAYTKSSLENLDVISAENVISVFKGNKPPDNYIVNKEIFS